MGGLVGAEFQAVLERNRDTFNARFANARRTNRALDPAAFAEYLRVCAQPTVIAAALAGRSNDAIDRLASALYDIALELVGRELAGPGGRYPVVSRVWAELLPLVEGRLGDDPRDMIAALTNAAANLSVEPPVDAQAWLDRMLDVEPHATNAAELLAVGQVLAWRAGMAHFRAGALEVLGQLPPTLADSLVGDVADPHSRWVSGPGETLRVVAQVGDFIGLGGAFDSPPEVLQADGHLFAYDNGGCWTVHVDRFGATLRRFGRELPSGDVRPARFSVSQGRVRLGGVGDFVPPLEVRSSACTDDMAALTSSTSHRITIVALSTP